MDPEEASHRGHTTSSIGGGQGEDSESRTRRRFMELEAEQISRLYRMYRADFELFGYQVDAYLQESQKRT